MTMGVDSQIDIVDSMPCPIVKNSRKKSFRICKEDPENAPRKGFSAVDQRYYIGYKLHLLTNEHGVFQDMQITPDIVHDINFLKELQPEEYCREKTLLGDRV
ncbi:MAG: transposase [Flavobacteriales bacterium]|nr:transposase [Flavobacteriales bacterium]